MALEELASTYPYAEAPAERNWYPAIESKHGSAKAQTDIAHRFAITSNDIADERWAYHAVRCWKSSCR